MMSEQEDNKWAMNERECIHRGPNTQGNYYSGPNYIKALQGLTGNEAMKMAGKVGAFFWADAPNTRVWLCEACAAEIGL
ncbi:MAG: hypothetical protein ICV60_02315 [Pyrinomonadaceae bacterium]|nr:hypothetical protein [Pyrinomonadaceae bacterium]